jgi:membrane associated rhomboid family serine protease
MARGSVRRKTSAKRTRKRQFALVMRDRFSAPVELVCLLMVVFFAIQLAPLSLQSAMGLVPRQPDRLLSILWHPLLHFSLAHLLANIIGILFLGVLISMFSRATFVSVTLVVWLLGGSILWVVGRGGHLVGGASGIVYGYLGFLMLRGIFDRKLLYILLSAFSVYAFHGLLAGLLPTLLPISWEGHLCGFIAGGISAFFCSRQSRS